MSLPYYISVQGKPYMQDCFNVEESVSRISIDLVQISEGNHMLSSFPSKMKEHDFMNDSVNGHLNEDNNASKFYRTCYQFRNPLSHFIASHPTHFLLFFTQLYRKNKLKLFLIN